MGEEEYQYYTPELEEEYQFQDYETKPELEEKVIIMSVEPAKTQYKDIPAYDGEYEILPKMQAQILRTKEKAMKENLIVDGIPVYKTGNLSGGYTVIIGG